MRAAIKKTNLNVQTADASLSKSILNSHQRVTWNATEEAAGNPTANHSLKKPELPKANTDLGFLEGYEHYDSQSTRIITAAKTVWEKRCT